MPRAAALAVLVCLAVLVLALTPSTGVHGAPAAVYSTYLPWVSLLPARTPLKGTAGTYADGRSLQLGSWGYNYTRAYNVQSNPLYETVPMIQLSSTPYTTTFTATPGQNWLIFNEPDIAGPAHPTPMQ